MALTHLRCPVCRKDVAADDPNMPFCSQRCRNIDLGNWAAEKYVISSPVDPNELAEAEIAERNEGKLR